MIVTRIIVFGNTASDVDSDDEVGLWSELQMSVCKLTDSSSCLESPTGTGYIYDCRSDRCLICTCTVVKIKYSNLFRSLL